MSKEVVWIDVDDLGIDTVNIRGGEWEHDEELVQDIKENGIINPILVRFADPSTGKNYAIVSGSRRYNAALEAGLSEVPCCVKEMDDVTAIGRTIAENIHSKDTPAWRYAVKIGEMYERLNHKGNKEGVINIMMKKIGLSRTSVQEYLNIAGLPGEIIELMKEPADRSEKVKELLKGMPLTASVEKALSKEKADKIARELEGIPKKKLFEVAVYVIGKPKDIAYGIIERVKSYPKASMEKLDEIVTGIPKSAKLFFEFGSPIIMAIDEACMRMNMDRKTLVTVAVKEWLRKRGFYKNRK